MAPKDIPEINIELQEVEVKGEIRKLRTMRDVIGRNPIKWLSYLWYWYWWKSTKQSWEAFLNTRLRWCPEPAKELHAYHDLDSEAELKALLDEESKETEIR